MDYSQLSDFEINCNVGEALGLIVVTNKGDAGNSVGLAKEFSSEFSYADYCNNPADAWPIITENRICISWDSPYATAKTIIGYHGRQELLGKISINKNALRAAMEVYLKLMEPLDA